MRAMRFIRDERGTTAVEFALTAPVFMAAMIGLLEVSLMVFAQVGLQSATELAARCGSINRTVCSSTSAIQSFAASSMPGFAVPTSVFSVANESCGTQVTASYAFTFVSTYFGVPSLTLNAKACFPR
jgi:Flp pilus assembly protein TadG